MGYCIQCDSCRDGYHVTCGHRCGVTFNVQTEDNSLKVLCKKCKSKSNRKEHRVLKDIEVNSSVVAKFHAHYAYAKLVSKKEDLFHRVQFVDNTLVSYIKSCDILVSLSPLFLSLSSLTNDRAFRIKTAKRRSLRLVILLR